MIKYLITIILLNPFIANAMKFNQEIEVSYKSVKRESSFKAIDVSNKSQYKYNNFILSNELSYTQSETNNVIHQRFLENTLKFSYLFKNPYGAYILNNIEKNSFDDNFETFTYGVGGKYHKESFLSIAPITFEIGYNLNKKNFKVNKNSYSSDIRLFFDTFFDIRIFKTSFSAEYLHCVTNKNKSLAVNPRIYLLLSNFISLKFNYEIIFARIDNENKKQSTQGFFIIFNI